MLPVNLGPDRRATLSTNTVAVKRQVHASVYMYIYIYRCVYIYIYMYVIYVRYIQLVYWIRYV